ncbi:MAG TPA: PepSY domain-containing protein [Thermoanaerobaculia bacterium]|jgi:hypothetical protein|nr:PepSY domain-containing protein [Thermoanaerobaculia bacterium]
MKSPLASMVFVGLVMVMATAGCAARPVDESARREKAKSEITRQQAIDIARKQVKFEPRQVDAEQTDQEGRPVWKVILRGQPPGPGHAMGEYMEVLVDRRTGEIVGLAMS